MKKMILATLAAVGIGALGGLAIQTRKNHPPPVSENPTGSATEPTPSVSNEPIAAAGQVVAKRRPTSAPSVRAQNPASDRENRPAVTPSGATEPGRAGPLPYHQAIETIASAQASHEQKAAAWKQLRESGRLDQAIGELEQRAGSSPDVAAYPAALGQAYLEKCGTIQDVREQGILAMKADQVLDGALNLDSNNWEARYTKAFAMSFWPTQMNRGPEVMQHFVTLVAQQEAQAPQPHFAQTYLRLGDEYQKYGYADYAQQTWHRGAALFPEDQELQRKLEAQ